MAVVLADLLDEKQIALELRAQTRDEALREIVGLLWANGKLRDPEKFLDMLIKLEREHSTVAEHGIAFPHARTNLVKEIVLGIGRSKAGLRFQKSGELVRLIFVIGVPREMIQDYLVCVGTLARLTKDDTIREALLKAETIAEFIEQLRTASLQLE
jgi:mannitol/fructose-specific phosphotransferase system IIA component (Ntr-type)